MSKLQQLSIWIITLVCGYLLFSCVKAGDTVISPVTRTEYADEYFLSVYVWQNELLTGKERVGLYEEIMVEVRNSQGTPPKLSYRDAYTEWNLDSNEFLIGLRITVFPVGNIWVNKKELAYIYIYYTPNVVSKWPEKLEDRPSIILDHCNVKHFTEPLGRNFSGDEKAAWEKLISAFFAKNLAPSYRAYLTSYDVGQAGNGFTDATKPYKSTFPLIVDKTLVELRLEAYRQLKFGELNFYFVTYKQGAGKWNPSN